MTPQRSGSGGGGGTLEGQGRRLRGRAGRWAALALLASVLAACSPTPANVAHGAEAEQPNASLTAPRITITNYAYHPDVLTVKAGSSVTVVNDDRANHTVTAIDGAFNTGPIAAGGAASTFVVAKPGTYHYYCELHPYMRGTIIATG